MQSEQINELAAALVAAQAEFSAVPKGSANPFFKSKYAALPDVVAHTAPVLAKHGLAVSQFIDGEYLGGDALITYVIHKSGQYLSHVMRLHLPKEDPQGQGSAVTYARRYSYMAALGLVADDDDDGNAASRPKQNSAPRPAPAPPKEIPYNNIRAEFEEKVTKPRRKAFIEEAIGRSIESPSDLTSEDCAKIMLELMQ